MNPEAHKEYSMASNTLEDIGFWSFDKEVLKAISHDIWVEQNERDLRTTREENTGSHDERVVTGL